MHHYTRLSGPQLEKQIQALNSAAATASGNYHYPAVDMARKKLLKKVESIRPLRRSEFINLHGYQAWIDYAKEHDLPENHKWADVGFKQGQTPVDRIADLMD